MLRWLQENMISPDQSIVCLEATGVYLYFLIQELTDQPPLMIPLMISPPMPAAPRVSPPLCEKVMPRLMRSTRREKGRLCR